MPSSPRALIRTQDHWGERPAGWVPAHGDSVHVRRERAGLRAGAGMDAGAAEAGASGAASAGSWWVRGLGAGLHAHPRAPLPVPALALEASGQVRVSGACGCSEKIPSVLRGDDGTKYQEFSQH